MSGVGARRWVVRGRVQGVGFRWFVQRQAVQLALRGYARNLPDGSVEVTAEGETASLDALEAALHRGAQFSRVDSVESIDFPHDVHLPKSFEMR